MKVKFKHSNEAFTGKVVSVKNIYNSTAPHTRYLVEVDRPNSLNLIQVEACSTFFTLFMDKSEVRQVLIDKWHQDIRTIAYEQL